MPDAKGLTPSTTCFPDETVRPWPARLYSDFRERRRASIAATRSRIAALGAASGKQMARVSDAVTENAARGDVHTATWCNRCQNRKI